MDENKYVRYRPKGSNWCTEPLEEFTRQLRHPDNAEMFGGDVYEFQLVEMTKEEYDALPEFDGF